MGAAEPSRRTVLVSATTMLGALTLCFGLPLSSAVAQTVAAAAEPKPAPAVAPAEVTAWIVIHPDDTVTIKVARAELGQGAFTSLPVLVVEELDCEWAKVRAEFVAPAENLRRKAAWQADIDAGGTVSPERSFDWGAMSTTGSRATIDSQRYLREAGAMARAMLVEAAAKRWIASVSECTVASGVITHTPSGRKIGYGAIAASAALIPPPSQVTLKDPKTWKICGKPTKHLTTSAKVNGSLAYAIDVRLPDMLYATIAQCPVFGGKLKSFDDTKVRALPGVRLVVKLDEQTVGVIADTFWQARKALAALPVVWDEGPNAKAASEAIGEMQKAGLDIPSVAPLASAAPSGSAPPIASPGAAAAPGAPAASGAPAPSLPAAPPTGAPPAQPAGAPAAASPSAAAPTAPQNAAPQNAAPQTTAPRTTAGGIAVATQIGDAQAAIEAAARKIEADYDTPFLAHAALEPMSCTARIGAAVEVWVGTEDGEAALAAAADAAGVPREAVVVNTMHVGGSFGRRSYHDAIRFAVLAAKRVGGRAVKLVYSREEDFTHDFYRPAGRARLRAAFDAKGAPTALAVRLSGQSVNAYHAPDRYKGAPDTAQSQGFDKADLGYGLPNVLVEVAMRNTPVPAGLWRSAYQSQNTFYKESFVDEMAVAAGKDPFEFRRGLLGGAPRQKRVLETVADKAGWGKPAAAGVARGIAVEAAYGSYHAVVAEVSVSDVGRLRVHRVVNAIDCGRVVNPNMVEQQMQGSIVMAISALLYGSSTVAKGRIVETNFDTYRVLRIDETPVIETWIVPSLDFWGGIGDAGLPAVAPAICNAIFAATRQRIRSLPLKQHKLGKA